MKISFEKQKQRLSLLFLMSAIVMLVLLITAAIAGIIVLFLIYRGTLEPGKTGLNAWTLLLYILLISFGIGTILTFTSMSFQIKPINKILNAMNQLASGDYSVRLSFKGAISKQQTVREFTDSFNQMASELEKTEMLRSDFINNFSHEFKTPIVSIAGFAKLLRRGNLTEERKNECLDIIEEESLRLSQMATNVLNLTKVENQTILTDVCEYNLTEQIRTCVLMLENKWSKKEIEFLLPENEYYITGNEELLKQVFLNIIDNAVKFSLTGKPVEIAVRDQNKTVFVDISNYGEEIPEETRKSIFNKFYQADTSHSTEGNGVGLAVAKKIVDLHAGTISVECENGKTTFTVALTQEL